MGDQMIVWLFFALLWVAWLIFVVLCPNQWSMIVDKENGFWVEKGIVKAATAERIARFEKGKGFKILLTVGLVLFLFNTWMSKSLP